MAVHIGVCRESRTIPKALLPGHFFDFDLYPFAHQSLFSESQDVIEVLDRLHPYLDEWLVNCALGIHGHIWLGGQQSEGTKRKALGVPISVLTQRATFSGRVVPQLTGGHIVPEISTDMLHLAEDDESANLDRLSRLADFDFIFHPELLLGRAVPLSECNAAVDPQYIFVGRGARILGGTFDVGNGSIFIGAGTIVEPGVTVKGPCYIGQGCELRSGAYLRGDVILGDGVVARGEIKHSVALDRAELCHPGYVGDSLLGHGTHFGCQALTANLGLLGGGHGTVVVQVGDQAVDVGRRKLGAIMGDFCQLGCNSVTEPGVFMGKRTFVYPLTRLPKGMYGPDELIKNKPLEHGIIERAPLI